MFRQSTNRAQTFLNMSSAKLTILSNIFLIFFVSMMAHWIIWKYTQIKNICNNIQTTNKNQNSI